MFLAMLAACAPYGQIRKSEDDLALAGFIAHYANTTARWQLMNLLPANRMAYRMNGTNAVLLYADPLTCGCVYMGNRMAYAAWISAHHGTPLQERQMTAEINQHPGWDWSVWSPDADPPEVRALHGLPSHGVAGY